MLSENIRSFRMAKGLSQEEFAVRLNVVRQTVSKWERGLSVPDSEMLVAVSDVLEVPVSTLLGETVAGSDAGPEENDLKTLAEKLEVLNLQLARGRVARRRALHAAFIALFVLVAACLAVLAFMNSPYLTWDFGDPEAAVAGTLFHAFEWVFVRLAPLLLAGSIVGISLTRKKG